ncbi:MAG: WYL domain-containing protein [Actinomycetales bacterium]|nr:WYL domain-containing protein [Actinomycetales bacterium]
MSAAPRLARLLALVPWLVAHPDVTIAECAQHFGVTEEELERDLWLVVVCGVPGYGPDQLVDIDFWDDGVIQVIDPQTLGRPMRLTQEEATTLLVSLRMLAQLPGIDGREAVLSAAAKLEEASGASGAQRQVAVSVGVPAQVSEVVDEALRAGRELSIRYAAATRDEVSERTILPLRLLVVDGIGYLEAECRSAGALRTFRLDRVLGAELGAPAAPITEGESQPRPPREATRAVLRLEPAARWIIDVHGADVRMADDGTGTAIVELPLLSLEWGVRLVLSLAGAATVVEPPELAHEVARAAADALASYP